MSLSNPISFVNMSAEDFSQISFDDKIRIIQSNFQQKQQLSSKRHDDMMKMWYASSGHTIARVLPICRTCRLGECRESLGAQTFIG